MAGRAARILNGARRPGGECEAVGAEPSGHLGLPAGAALAVDQLAPIPGPHAGSETDPPGSVTLGYLVWVMHKAPR